MDLYSFGTFCEDLRIKWKILIIVFLNVFGGTASQNRVYRIHAEISNFSLCILKSNKSFSIFFSDDFCPMLSIRIGFNADPDQRVEFYMKIYFM